MISAGSGRVTAASCGNNLYPASFDEVKAAQTLQEIPFFIVDVDLASAQKRLRLLYEE